MRAVSRSILLLGFLSIAAPLWSKKAPEDAVGPAKGGIVQSHRAAPALSKPDTKVVPGAAVYFDQATGLARKVTSHGLATQAKTPGSAAEAFLKENHRLFGLAADLSDLSPVSSQSSLGGFHLRYQQVVGGLPVWEAQVAVHLSKDLRIRLVQSTVLPIPKPPAAKLRLNSEKAIAVAQAAMGITGNLRAPASASLVIYADKQPARLCWRVLIPADQPLGDWEVLVDAVSGQALVARNLLRFVSGSGMVFDPSPVSTSGVCTLTDNNDADYAALNDQRISRTLQGLDGSGYLEGPYVSTTPTKQRAYETSFVYNYTRSDDHFEQVMAYYHLDVCQRYIQSLGFTNVNNRAQPVDVNGTPQDNSWYSPSTGIITYGSGGVDDAEDADVILHEYGHAIQDNQVPGFGATDEGGAMGEGFGDYLAATRYAEVNWTWRVYIAEWDAISYNPGCPAYLRRVDSTKHYPEDMVGEVHLDGEIWSACLWQMRGALGAATADEIIIESHFYLTPTSQFRDGADAIILADQNLNGGANEAVITQIFTDRGILVEVTDAAQIALDHTWPSDLKVWLGVVGNPFTPILVSNRQPQTQWTVALSAYSAYLPPSGTNKWYAMVQDFAAFDVGSITKFMINWAGTDYASGDPPVPIPDVGGGPVYAYIPSEIPVLVGDAYPQLSDSNGDGDSDDCGEFGDDTIDWMDVISVYYCFIETSCPQAASARFDAMDSYPPDQVDGSCNLVVRGGDGIIDWMDVITTYYRFIDPPACVPIRPCEP